MKSTGMRNKILLISSPENNSFFIKEALKKSDYELFESKSSESGMQKVIEYKPDLIICENEMNDYNGFQMYNLLQDILIKNGILFFIYSDTFDKEDILIGLEMGIDNFIISPVDENLLLNKIKLQLLKIKGPKVDEELNFDAHFETTPVARFIIRNNQIVKINKAFCQVMQCDELEFESIVFNEMFNILENNVNEMNYRKCMNGFIPYCRLNKVTSGKIVNHVFDIYLEYNQNDGKGKLFGELVPNGRKVLAPEDVLFTTLYNKNKKYLNINNLRKRTPKKVKLTDREIEVLKLSSEGIPIKQIAEYLGLSQRTIEKHRGNIMRKTNSSNIIEAICEFNKQSERQLLNTI